MEPDSRWRSSRLFVLLLGCSLLLHLCGLALVARLAAPDPAAPPAGLSVRLVLPPAAPAAPLAAAGTAPAPAVNAATAAWTPPPALLGIPAPASGQGAAGDGDAGDHPNTALPAPARLSYASTADHGQARSAGTARLDWFSDGMRYRIAFETRLGATLTQRSSGMLGDDGIEAQQQSAGGVQDALAALFQLIGIVHAAHELPATVTLRVAAPGTAHGMRFVLAGTEDLALPAGRWHTVRYAQVAPAGTARLDVWLAPERDWLPVQLRTTGPAGSVTHRLTAVRAGGAP